MAITIDDPAHDEPDAVHHFLRRLGGQFSAQLNGVAVLLALAALLFAGHAAAAAETETADPAADPKAQPRMRLQDVGRGELLFRDEDGKGLVPAPLVGTEVRITVNGPVARAVVRQRFRNPGKRWMEGVYVFPLPEQAAVDGMRLKIGERVVEGRIAEREAAHREYEQAKSEGRKASLLDQERPNMFTTSVANIGPGEEIAVEIDYRETLAFEQTDAGGVFRLRFPMVVGPRYIPAEMVLTPVAEGGWTTLPAGIEDAQRISPPVKHPDAGPAINPVDLRVEIDPGFPLARLASVNHRIDVTEVADGRRIATLADGTVPADRDFVLEWAPQAGTVPTAGLFAEQVDGATYLLLMLLPPQGEQTGEQPADGARLPREVVFIIDKSGSMHGPSLQQAKAALALALDRLGPDDRFNVIAFDNTATALFPAVRRPSEDSLGAAARFLQAIEADGGTEMRQALRMALDGRSDPARLRQIVFLTDGAVGNEAELFRMIAGGLGDSRLFTVGIGSAPNSYFMRKAAQHGRGSFTYIDDVAEVGTRMQELFAKLERPAATDIAVTWPDGITPETWPQRVPDLYRGEPVVVTARLPQGATPHGEVQVAGRLGIQPWTARLPLDRQATAAGVASLWARSKVGALMDGLTEGVPEPEVRQQVLAVALPHRLVTQYTSLVAVDATPSRPQGEGLASGQVPTNLPQGWDYEKVFGQGTAPQPRRPQPTNLQLRKAAAPGSPQQVAAAAAPAAGASWAKIGSNPAFRDVGVPQGATFAPLHLLVGMLALMIGAVLLGLWVVLWRRTGRSGVQGALRPAALPRRAATPAGH